MKKNLFALLILFITCSCAPKFNYAHLQSSMASGNCTGSADLLKNSKETYGDKATLLYLLDSGMINFQCNNLKYASKSFSDADELAQNLWTKSISKEAASYATNDFVIPYRGEDFERALINLFSAFCYIKLNQYDEAMADCRRLDTVLIEYNKKYDKKNVYKEDALGRYISGLLSEAEKEYSEAYIYYDQSLRAFKNYNAAYGTAIPKCLYEDILRVSEPADRLDDAQRLIPSFDSTNYVKFVESEKMGKIVMIHFNGKAPEKVENKFTVPTPSGPISIAFPKYVTTPPQCHTSKMVVKSSDKTFEENAVLFENINAIALKDLDDRKARTIVKTIARLVVKQAVVHAGSEEVEKKYGAMAGLATKIAGNIAASALERADTRAWRTLPGEINVARMFVPEGDYQVSAESCHHGTKSLDTFHIKAGETKFVFYDTIY
jgi:hypothetical protein